MIIYCTCKSIAAKQITLQVFQSEIILPCVALIIYHAKNVSNKRVKYLHATTNNSKPGIIFLIPLANLERDNKGYLRSILN
jgi:hypothetical protein